MVAPFEQLVGALRKPPIYDCFLFYNELDLLELRLRTVFPFVEKIILAECTHTISGEPKPLYFQANRKRFAEFESKIIHLITPEPKEEHYHIGMGRRSTEVYQRRNLIEGLNRISGLTDNQIIFVSDLDEIPNPEVFSKVRGALACGELFVTLRQYWHLLFLNARVVESFNRGAIDDPCRWFGTMACTRRTLRRVFRDDLNALWGCKWGDSGRAIRKIENGGWHFSYLGGVERVLQKLRANALPGLVDRDFEDLMRKRFVGAQFELINLDQSFPKELQNGKGLCDKYFVRSDEYESVMSAFISAAN